LVNRTNKEFLEYLSKKVSISTAFAQLLVNRGYKDAESIKYFLSPSLGNLHDPFLLSDMEKAVQRIKTALASAETVLVCGDYDADGITSTALLVSALRTFGLKTHYHIPNRITEGYGLTSEGIQKAKVIGASLIITVDCGISSEKEVSIGTSQGIDIIITDHHEPPKRLPDAAAIINPHREDSGYPFKYLAGVGVAYKVVQAISQDSRFKIQNSKLEDFLALVAIGTIADSVPLIGENRILVTYGLKALNKNSSHIIGIQSLKETAGIGDRDFRSGILSYTIIPRINAAGRLGDANEVVELFLSQDESITKKIAFFLEEQNKKRQKIEEDVYKSALNMIGAYPLRSESTRIENESRSVGTDSAIVLYSSEWHPGVIGIVASRLVEMFYRPTFLFSVKDGIAKGSARSIPPFHIYKGIAECAELLIGYGGHSQAAGLKLHAENLYAFKERINSIVENALSEEDLIPSLEIDVGIELFEVNFNLVGEISLLEPFGSSNEEPVFGAKGLEVINPRVVGNNHLKMRLKQRNISIDTIGFDMGNFFSELPGLVPTLRDGAGLTSNSDPLLVDAVFVPCINEWNGSRSLQLNLKAVRPST
jgi:single-stranded-DNA-specific exonuclease